MAKEAFAGDKQFRLPQVNREPYRLWFEFLKLALQQPTIVVDRKYYAAWGNVANEDFANWWEKHWRELFVVRAKTEVITAIADARAALTDPMFAVLRVSLDGTKQRRMKDIKDALSGIKLSAANRKLSSSIPRFELTQSRSIDLKVLRGSFKLLEFYFGCGSNIDEAFIAYNSWSQNWNDKARKWNNEKKSKGRRRSLIYQPSFLRKLIEEIEHKRTNLIAGKKNDRAGVYTRLHNDAYKVTARALKILNDVGSGEFAGKYQMIGQVDLSL